jgi:hypothetical protein
MRVFNLTTLHGDIDLHLSAYFGRTASLGSTTHTGRINQCEKKYVDWVKTMWVKYFMKTQEAQEHFLYDIRVRRLPPMFDLGTSGAPLQLEVRTPIEELTLSLETEWDVKDADAGTLFYYSPGVHTLSRYYTELLDVRDYVFSLINADANVDLGKRSYQDMKRASTTWHAEQQRILQARMETEAALRRAVDSSRALPAWDHLMKGSDWELAVPEPFELNGIKFLILRLKSQSALDFESYVMEHCVHSYGRQLVQTDPLCIILSVRALDSAHLPLVTAELSASATEAFAPYYIQFRGKHNHPAEQTIVGIERKLRELVSFFTKETYYPVSEDLSFVIKKSLA